MAGEESNLNGNSHREKDQYSYIYPRITHPYGGTQSSPYTLLGFINLFWIFKAIKYALSHNSEFNTYTIYIWFVDKLQKICTQYGHIKCYLGANPSRDKDYF